MHMKKLLIATVLMFTAFTLSPARDKSGDIRIRVDKVWDNGMYNAFTSLVEFNGRYYIAFREETGHIWGDDDKAEGKIRILESRNGRKWESVAILSIEGYDLRDPNLTITPDGRLMLSTMRALYKGRNRLSGVSMVAFSNNGRDFGDLTPVVMENPCATGFDWIWKLAWGKDGNGRDAAYGVCYSGIPNPETDLESNTTVTALLKTYDGVNYSFVAKLPFAPEEFSNETAPLFLPDGRLALWVRREKGGTHGYWGVSAAPYDKWEFKDMGMRLGGPFLCNLDDDTIVACSRSYNMPTSYRTVLMSCTAEGDFREVCILPSGGDAGDTAYAGMIVVKDELWVSYYSRKGATRPSIYLARIPTRIFK